jgi:hypothetical protein
MGVSVLSGGAPTCHLIDHARPSPFPTASIAAPRRAVPRRGQSSPRGVVRIQPIHHAATCETAYPAARISPARCHCQSAVGAHPLPIPRPRPAPPSWFLLHPSPQQQQAMAGHAFFLVQKATPPRSHLAISLVASNEMDRIYTPCPISHQVRIQRLQPQLIRHPHLASFSRFVSSIPLLLPSLTRTHRDPRAAQRALPATVRAVYEIPIHRPPHHRTRWTSWACYRRRLRLLLLLLPGRRRRLPPRARRDPRRRHA